MRRFHLFEIEDQPWLPDGFRNLLTDFLEFLSSTLRIYAPVIPLIDTVLRRTHSRRITDLCSGAAGPWCQLLAARWDVSVTLTDRFPNRAAFARAKARYAGQLDYCPEPVDARHIPARLDGMRTLFNGFHHFRPIDAQAILQGVVDQRMAVGIFEIADRTPRILLSVLFGVPLLALVATPFIRPLSLSRLFWTYGVPLVPLCLVWDGLVSMLRTYSAEELASMVTAVDKDTYQWEFGRLAPPFPAVPVSYLLGYPREQLPQANRGTLSPDVTAAVAPCR